MKNKIFMTIRNATLVLIILVAIGNLIIMFLPKKEAPQIEPPQKSLAAYKTLYPGTSTAEDVISTLGEPLSSKENFGNIIYEYESNNPNLPHEFITKDKSLVFIKETVTLGDGKRISDITERYGKTRNVLYGPGSLNGFYLHVYPETGIAYIGHPQSEIILEIWYFPPTTLAEFKENWASDFSDTPVERQ